jgi:hypothetical protein
MNACILSHYLLIVYITHTSALFYRRKSKYADVLLAGHGLDGGWIIPGVMDSGTFGGHRGMLIYSIDFGE